MLYMTYEIIPTRWPIKAWPKLKQLMGPLDVNIAGGYAAWHMSDRFDWHGAGKTNDVEYNHDLRAMVPSDYPNDLDIFTYDYSGYFGMVNNLTDAGFTMEKESKYCSTWHDTGNFLKEDNWNHLRLSLNLPDQDIFTKRNVGISVAPKQYSLPIQLIKPIFGKNLYKVLEHFDFYAAKFAILDGKTMLAHKDALACLDARSLKHAHPDAIISNPFYVLARTMKYAKKGFKVNYMEMYKLIVNAQAANPESLNLDELHEIIVYFGQYLTSGKKLGRGEDFRETFQDAYGQWLRYLLDKKAKL